MYARALNICYVCWGQVRSCTYRIRRIFQNAWIPIYGADLRRNTFWYASHDSSRKIHSACTPTIYTNTHFIVCERTEQKRKHKSAASERTNEREPQTQWRTATKQRAQCAHSHKFNERTGQLFYTYYYFSSHYSHNISTYWMCTYAAAYAANRKRRIFHIKMDYYILPSICMYWSRMLIILTILY